MFWVITPGQQPPPLQLDQRPVRAVRLLAIQDREALTVNDQKRAGSRRQTEMWATSIGSTFSQTPLPGVRKSGIPEGTEIPAPVRATTGPDETISSARRSALNDP